MCNSTIRASSSSNLQNCGRLGGHRGGGRTGAATFILNTHICDYLETWTSLGSIEESLGSYVTSKERSAQVKDLEQKADIVSNEAANLLQQKIKRKREQVAKSKADAQQKKNKKKKKHFDSKNWRED